MSVTSSVKTWAVCFGLDSLVGGVAIAGADSTAKIQCVGFPELALFHRSELPDRLRSMLDDLIKNRVRWQRN